MHFEGVDNIRRELEEKVGEKVKLTAYGGRRKTIIKKGVIENTYPSIFVVRVDNNNDAGRTMSFSYTDILTNAVKLEFGKDKTVTA